ncbi:TolC family protein [bacterium]|nr:TolC family protein [bacterium]
MFSSGAHAGDYTAVEVGNTGLYLENSALHQVKHYLKQDEDLLFRIGCLMEDVDTLLERLHALPPEYEGSRLATAPVHEELAGLIGLALAGNPELAPYRSQMAVQAARTRQAGAKKDPMISFKLANFPVPQFDLESTPMTQFILGWSQTYEGYGKRSVRRSIGQLEEVLTELSLAQRELELIGEVNSLYFSMVGTTASLRVIEENMELLGLLIELAERKYAIGITPQARVLSAQLELTRLEERKIKLGKLLESQQEMLAGQLGHPAGFDPASLSLVADYPLPGAIQWDDEELLHAALSHRPDYQRLHVMQEQQDMMLELAKRGYRPDYTISASYGVRWGKRDFFSAGVSIPLFTHKEERQDAKVQEAYAMQAVSGDRMRSLENMLSTRLGTLRVKFDRLGEIIDLYRLGLLPQARLALDSSIATYAANQLDLSDLIKAQQVLLNYELELEQQYIDYLSALAELQVITSGTFDPGPYLSVEVQGPPLEPGDPLTLAPEPTPLGGELPFVEQLGLPGEEHAPAAAEEQVTWDDFYRPFVQGNKEERNG